MAKKELTLTIRARNAMAAGLKNARKALSNFGRSAMRIGTGIAKTLIATGAAVLGLGTYFVKASSDADETRTKFDAVFSSMIPKANAMANALAKDFGLAGSSARKMLGDTGDLLVGFGMSEDAAMAMADKVARLGVDLASFTNYSGGATGASTALTKALLGETEMAKSLGIVIRQNTKEFRDAVQAKMVSADATESEAKAMVILDMAMQQTTKAQGDYARTQDGIANRARLVTERFKEFRESIGEIISESTGLSDVMGVVAKGIETVTQRIKEWADSGGITNLIAQVKTFASEATAQFSRIQAYVEYAFQEAFETVSWFGNASTVVFQNAGKIITNIWRNTTNSIGDYLAELHAKVKNQDWNPPPPNLTDIFDGIKDVPKHSEAARKKLAENLEKIDSDNAKRLEEISKEQTESFLKDNKEKVEAAKETAKAEEKLAKDTAKKVATTEKKASDDALKDKLRDIQKEKAAIQDLARSRVQAVIDARKAEKAEEQGMAEDRERARKLIEKKDRGIRLNKKDAEFLKAFGEVWKAQQKETSLDKAEAAATAQINEQKKQLQKLGEVGSNTGKIVDLLNKNLGYSGG